MVNMVKLDLLVWELGPVLGERRGLNLVAPWCCRTLRFATLPEATQGAKSVKVIEGLVLVTIYGHCEVFGYEP